MHFCEKRHARFEETFIKDLELYSYSYARKCNMQVKCEMQYASKSVTSVPEHFN